MNCPVFRANYDHYVKSRARARAAADETSIREFCALAMTTCERDGQIRFGVTADLRDGILEGGWEMIAGPTVFVVDDDHVVRNCVRRLVESVHLSVETFGSADEFLHAYNPSRPGCLVLDLRMPGMSGLELQRRLIELGYSLPIIMLSGYGDVSVAVRAMKAGAVSFLEKPFNEHLLLDTIREAIEKDADNRRKQARVAEFQARIARLTPREREVMDLLVAGNVSKVVAAKLRLSEKTIEVHRAHVMKKLQAKTIADLVRFALLSGTNKGNS